MLLIKDRKKNKQPRFRMMVPREFVFQPSEQDLPKQAMKELENNAEENLKANEKKYEQVRAKHFEKLEGKEAKAEEKEKVNIIENQDKVVGVNKLMQELATIDTLEISTTPNSDRSANNTDIIAKIDAIEGDSEISRWIINCAKLAKFDQLCEIKGYNNKNACKKQDYSGYSGITEDYYPPLFDGNPLRRAALDARGTKENMEAFDDGDMLSASFMLMVWNSSPLLIEGKYKLPILGSTFFNEGRRKIKKNGTWDGTWPEHSYEEFHHKLSTKWGAEHSVHNDDYKCVPAHPFLCYYYLLDGENVNVIDSHLLKYVRMITENLYPEDLENPFEETGEKELKDNAYRTDAKATIKGPDWTQGLDFTEKSKAVFMLFLGTVMIHSYELPSLTIDWSDSKENRCLAVYEWVCKKQESHLKGMFRKETVHWSFSEWGASGGFMPSLLGHTAQSMEHLNIRLIGKNKKPVCSACPKDYMAYYGANWYAVNKKRDLKWKNYSGICTQYIDQIADILELTEEEKNNPWWLNWVGTWQQAQRRVDAYKKKQQEMYDNADPRYSFVDYYMNLMILQVDLWVKKLFNVCNVKVDDSGDEEQELSEAEKKKWAWVDAAKAGGVAAGAAAGGAAGTFFGGPVGTAIGATVGGLGAAFAAYGASKVFATMGEMIRVGGVLLYKVIGLVLRSPMVQEALLSLAIKYKEKICIKTAAKSRNFSIVKTGDDGNLKKMNDLGQWYSIDEEEQKTIEEDETKRAAEKAKRKFMQFFAVLQEMCGGEGDSFLMTALGGTALYINGAFAGITNLLMKVPGLGHMMETIGLDEEKLQGLIIVGLTQTGTKNFNAMVKANSTFARLKKLYHVLMESNKSCLTAGKLVIKDGGLLGDGKQYVNYAWETMNFNMPYYALMILNELASTKQLVKKEGTDPPEFVWEGKDAVFPWSPNFETEKNKVIQNFIASQTVPGGEAAFDKETEKNAQEKVKQYQMNQVDHIKKLDLELKLFDVQKADNDLYHAMSEGPGGFSTGLGNSAAITGELSGLNAKQRNDLEQAYRELEQAVEKFTDDRLAEDRLNNLYWWGAALTIAAGIGLAVATGGASVAIQAGMGMASSAAASIGAAGATAAATVAANAGGIVAGVTGVKTLIDANVSKGDQKVLMVGAATLMYRGIASAAETLGHWNDDSKIFVLASLFQHQYAWGEIFRAELERAIDKIKSDASGPPTTNGDTERMHLYKCVEFRKIICANEALTIKWADPGNLSYLDIDESLKWFGSYGPPIV